MALFWWPWGECVKVCFYLGGLFFFYFLQRADLIYMRTCKHANILLEP